MTNTPRLILATAIACIAGAAEASAAAPEGMAEGPAFGVVNWVVLLGYLGAMVGIGFWCSRHGGNTEQFFVAGRKIPGWAAGLSVYSTQLSALTFMALPAATAKGDWVRFPNTLVLVLVFPVVIYYYLPFFRQIPSATVYEYVERRFNLSLRWVSAISWMTFTIGRMGFVLYLPSLALSIATGIEVSTCIVIMGVLATLYTVLGGVEAVIWTDVVQFFVLIGGALLCAGVMIYEIGGFGTFFSHAVADDKFRMAMVDESGALETSLFEMSLWVMIVGGFFSHLIPYTTDQTVIQRYFTTPTTREAAKALWLNFIITVPFILLFYGLGTALHVFYETQAGAVPSPDKDAMVPWFIVHQLPIGISGLVIAAVFAATMSTLDSSINSIATSVVNDFYKRVNPNADEANCFRLARWLTLIIGVFGTLAAIGIGYLPENEAKYDQFITVQGIFGGPILGTFILAIFTKRATAEGTLVGIVASIVAITWVTYASKINSYLFIAVGMLVCVVVGYIASLLVGDRGRNLAGMTIHTRVKTTETT